MLPWFVAQLKPGSEAVAVRNLEHQGVQIFSPFEEVTARKSRKFVQARKALFPGYLFASFDPELVRWRSVNSTMGVSRLVSFRAGQPASVPQDLITCLMRRCDQSGKLLPPPSLQRGDKVSIARGPFAEFVGTVDQIARDLRIWVLLDILGKSTPVAIRPADLQRA